MATGTSSSKRKSSSSHKKKSTKKPSEVKKRRRSRSHKKNKSKSRDASVSYSDDDSRAEDFVSISSSDSEDDYRSRRARSLTRKDEKGSKKRVQRSSSSPEDSKDSPHRKKKKKKVSKLSVAKKYSPSRRKKKRSNRKDGSKGRKKTHHMKPSSGRSRRDKSVDSVSSDSRSHSTSRDESSGSEESEFERSRGRSVGMEKRKRSLSKTDIDRDRYGYRSRSSSPCSKHSSYLSEERLTSEYYSRRLQSVLTDEKVSKEAEGRDHSRDENKTEIVQDYDDYPSSRSNDSYDGGRRKDSLHIHASEEKRKVDGLMVEEALTSKSRTTEFTQRSREDVGTQCVNSDPTKDVIESTKMVNKTSMPTGIVSSEVADLESILRQKALENLKKFRGGLNTNNSALGTKKNESDNPVKQRSTAKADTTSQIRKEAGDILAGSKDMVVQPMKNVSKPTMHRNPGLNTSTSALGIEKNDSNNAVKQPSTAKDDTARPQIRKGVGDIVAGSKDMVVQDMKNVGVPTMQRTSATSKNDSPILGRNYKPSESKAQLNASSNVVLGAGTLSSDQIVAGKTIAKNSTNLGVITNNATKSISTLRQESPRDHSIINQAPTSLDSPNPMLLASKNIVDKNVAETPKDANRFSNAHGAEVIKACGSAAPEASCITPVTGEHGSNEPVDAAKGSSQFEQKTMSVMRGGEIVQVSYKVYIPKKPPALARRKLQR